MPMLRKMSEAAKIPGRVSGFVGVGLFTRF